MKIDMRLEPLIELLQQETDLYRSMQVVVDQEKDAALNSDLAALTEAGIKKEKILVELQKMEEKRHQLVADLAQTLGYADQALTLSKISQLVDEPLAGNLKRVRRDLLSVVSQLQAAGRRNKQIFEHTLVLLRGSFNLLNDLLTPNAVYYRTGTVQNAKSSGKCVCSDI